MMEVNDPLVHNSLRLLGQGAWTDIYLIWINLFSFLLFVFTHMWMVSVSLNYQLTEQYQCMTFFYFLIINFKLSIFQFMKKNIRSCQPNWVFAKIITSNKNWHRYSILWIRKMQVDYQVILAYQIISGLFWSQSVHLR